MIRKYNDFVKQKVNENINEPSFEETEGKLAAQDLEAELSNFEEEEEEAIDIFKKRLEDLAKLLGVEVTDNKVIYNDKEIIFPSETEMYHVDRKKFKTAEEVVDYLTKE